MVLVSDQVTITWNFLCVVKLWNIDGHYCYGQMHSPLISEIDTHDEVQFLHALLTAFLCSNFSNASIIRQLR